VTGNGEAIYYVVDKNELVGVNRAKSASIEILLEDGKIAEIIQNQSPDGTLNPPLEKPDSEMRLEGFSWLPHLRPGRDQEGLRSEGLRSEEGKEKGDPVKPIID